jgi:hypothetical protein
LCGSKNCSLAVTEDTECKCLKTGWWERNGNRRRRKLYKEELHNFHNFHFSLNTVALLVIKSRMRGASHVARMGD